MKTQLVSVSVLALMGALSIGTASASVECSVPQADQQPMEALQTKLEADGWAVKKIKVEDGCYEAYATTPEGKRVEAFFNPQTFELLETKED